MLVGGAIEVGEAGFWWRWTHRRPPAVGAETLVGARGVALDAGWVRVNGERWRAEGDVAEGDAIVVERVDGLTLLVRRDAA